VFLDVAKLELQENAVKTMVLLHLDPFRRLFSTPEIARTYGVGRKKARKNNVFEKNKKTLICLKIDVSS
jgi:hypothetical protein